MTDDLAPPDRDALVRDADFVTRWNAGDPAALQQLDAATRAAAPESDKPRPPSAAGETTLLTQAQSRQLAQASLDAGADPAGVMAAMADDVEFKPDLRSKAERAYAEDFEPGHPERYSVPADRYFGGDRPQEQEALADVTRQFVAQLGFDRSGGSELAGEITKAIAEQRGMRQDGRAAYEQRQAALLGSKRDQLVADAGRALAECHPDVVTFMRQAGALSNANVVFALASMAQARAARA